MNHDDEDQRKEGVLSAAGCLLFLFIASLLGFAVFAFGLYKLIQLLIHR